MRKSILMCTSWSMFFDDCERLKQNENYCQRMTRHVSRQISWYYARVQYKWRERKWIEWRNSGLPLSSWQNQIGFRVLWYQYLLQNRHSGRGHDATQTKKKIEQVRNLKNRFDLRESIENHFKETLIVRLCETNFDRDDIRTLICNFSCWRTNIC